MNASGKEHFRYRLPLVQNRGVQIMPQWMFVGISPRILEAVKFPESGNYKLMPFRPHGEYRARRSTHHILCDAAYHDMR